MTPEKTDQRIFENNTLEKLSKTNAYYVITVYITFSAGIITYSTWTSDISYILQVSLFISGLLLFSFTEYIVHRYFFHSSKSSDKRTLTYRLHQIHHDHPRDKKRLALPLPLGLLIAALVYGFFWLFLGRFTGFFFPGFIIGYAMYLLIHYLIHTRRPPNNGLRVLWKNHYIHHYKNHKKAYGVTSPLWDIIFNTQP